MFRVYNGHIKISSSHERKQVKTRKNRLILWMITMQFFVSCGQAQVDIDLAAAPETPSAIIVTSGMRTNTPLPASKTPPLDQNIDKETPVKEITSTESIEVINQEEPTQNQPNMLRIEEALQNLGYYEVGFVDGIFDQQTALAIKHLQWLNGLNISGEISDDFYVDLLDGNFLGVSSPLPFPAKSLSQYTAGFMMDGFLKSRLLELGYLDSKDPSFNPFEFDKITDEAVKAFQKQNGLISNGVVDFNAWQILFKSSVIKATGDPILVPPDASEDWNTSFFPILNDPIDLLYDGKYFWVLHSSGEDAFRNLLLRVDPKASLIDQSPPVMVGTLDIQDNEIVEMIYAGNRIWLLLPHSYDSPELINFIPETAEVFYRTTFVDCEGQECFPAYAIGYDGDKVWATTNDRAWAINRSNGKGYLSQQIGWLAHGEMAFDGRCMWISSEVGLTTFHTGGLYQCPAEEIAYAMPSDAVIFDGERIWAADEGFGLVYWLDIDSGMMGDPIPVGAQPTALLFDGNILWVANKGENTVLGIDVQTGSVGEPIPTGREPVALAFDGNRLWVANAGDQTLQAVEIKDYYIQTIQPTSTVIPSQTPTEEPTTAPTTPVFIQNLYLHDPQMTGDDVLILQQRLLDLGYTEVGTADGIFGPKTDEAVRHFQEINDLFVDGIVGPITWEVLFSDGAKGP